MSSTLLEVLRAEGELEARQVIDRARDEAGRIDMASAQRVARDLEARLAARSQELRLTESAEKVKARGRARESGFGIRERVVNDVLQRTRQLLAGAATDSWLQRQIAAVIEYLPEGGAELLCAKKDLAAVKKIAAGRPHTAVTVESGILAGVVAAMSDGTLRVDGTAEARLERMRAALAIEIVRAVEAR
jgi:vacuolar-type H+-ATPase subunit E/Vma4